jgi:hypothetical protein
VQQGADGGLHPEIVFRFLGPSVFNVSSDQSLQRTLYHLHPLENRTPPPPSLAERRFYMALRALCTRQSVSRLLRRFTPLPFSFFFRYSHSYTSIISGSFSFLVHVVHRNASRAQKVERFLSPFCDRFVLRRPRVSAKTTIVGLAAPAIAVNNAYQ